MKTNFIITAVGAALIGLAAITAPIASADASVVSTPGNVQVVATPGAAAAQAAVEQQPFYGDETALLFHHGGHGGGHR